MKIVLIRCPQPSLIGVDTGAMYSPNRECTPEPTLPQLEGIIKSVSDELGDKIKVVKIDLRDKSNGDIDECVYGQLKLPYISEKIAKRYSAIDIKNYYSEIREAEVVGFTNNFTMSRGVVLKYIRQIRVDFPDKEIWIGGRDIYSDVVVDVYAGAADKNKLVVFFGHTFLSLKNYLSWKMGRLDISNLFGVRVYTLGDFVNYPMLSGSDKFGRIPLPIYREKSLDFLGYSGEGVPDESYEKFVHMTISYGCPYKCGYCLTGVLDRCFQFKSIHEIKSELAYYKDLGVQTIAIMDDNLLCIPKEALWKILQEINKAGFDVEYGNGLQLSLIENCWGDMSRDLFRNCVSLYVPLEDLTISGRYKKLMSLSEEEKTVRRIVKADFEKLRYVTMGVIIGIPGHKKKELDGVFLDNVQRFLELFGGSNIEVCMTVFNYIPIPGTDFGEQALRSGRIVTNDFHDVNPEIFNFHLASYAPDGMTHGELYNVFLKAIDLNPAGREFGISYSKLQRFGGNKLGIKKCPEKYKKPGFHMRASM